MPVPTKAAIPRVTIISVTTLQELRQHAPQILERIHQMHNGVELFISQPLRLFEDIGVSLAPAVKDELVRMHGPAIIDPKRDQHYVLTRRRATPARYRIKLHGLFKGVDR